MNDLTVTQLNQLTAHVAEIRRLGKRVVGDVIEIGRRLTECKRIVGHGNWELWLKREFGWTDRTALNFMRVYELAKAKSENFSDLNLPVSGLYLLAAPSTPEPARTEAIDRAKAGEQLSHQDVQQIVHQHRPASGQPSRSPTQADWKRRIQIEVSTYEKVIGGVTVPPEPPPETAPAPKPPDSTPEQDNEPTLFDDLSPLLASEAPTDEKLDAASTEPAEAPQPPDSAREHLAYILGGAGAFRHVPLDADFDRMATVIDPGERERCKKAMNIVSKIARRLLIALERSDLERGDSSTLPPAAA